MNQDELRAMLLADFELWWMQQTSDKTMVEFRKRYPDVWPFLHGFAKAAFGEGGKTALERLPEIVK